MGSKVDDGPQSRRTANGGGRVGARGGGKARHEPLAAELEELYEHYGDAGNLPRRLLDLARRIDAAYERLSGGADPSFTGHGRR